MMLRFVAVLAAVLAAGTTVFAQQRVFVTDRALTAVFHYGVPCQSQDDARYRFTLEPRVPSMGIRPEHVANLLRAAIDEIDTWEGRNFCRAGGAYPGVAEIVYDGTTYAEARFEVRDRRVADTVIEASGAVPEPDRYSALIASALSQDGAIWGGTGAPPAGYDNLAAAEALAALAAEVPRESHADYRYLLARQLHLDYLARYRAASGRDGFDRSEFEAPFRDEDGVLIHHNVYAEAAQLGHPGAISDLFRYSGLSRVLHDVVFNRPGSGIRKLPRETIDAAIRSYGYLIGLGQEENVGRIVTAIADYADEGYRVSEKAIFRDSTLLPGRPVAERALNRALARQLELGDGALADLYGLPSGAVFDCDGTWCNALGGSRAGACAAHARVGRAFTSRASPVRR